MPFDRVTTRTTATAAAVLLAVVGLALALAPPRATADGRFTRELNIDRSGNDIRVETLQTGVDATDCETMCAATKGCVAYTFVKQSATVPKPLCRIKDQAPYGHESSCCVSGALKQ